VFVWHALDEVSDDELEPGEGGPCPLRYDFLLGGTPWAQVRIISFRSSTQLAPRSEKGDTKPIVLLSKGHHRRFFLYGGLTPGTLQITRGRVSSASEPLRRLKPRREPGNYPGRRTAEAIEQRRARTALLGCPPAGKASAGLLTVVSVPQARFTHLVGTRQS
jgi:hypothetical protein